MNGIRVGSGCEILKGIEDCRLGLNGLGLG